MSQLLQQAWLRRGVLARLLWPISLVYRGLVALRGALYCWGYLKQQRVCPPCSSVPPLVIVVGNVIAGGAGKTPTVLALLAHFHKRGLQVGVVSGGYGRTRHDCMQVHRNSPASEVGDEPLLIHRRSGAPVFVARQRVQAVQALLRAYPQTQVVLCDDGLQHLALARNIEIAVFDERGVGNGWLLPAGLLREPWPRSVDLVLHTGQTPAPGIEGFVATRRLADHAVRADGSQVSLATLQREPVHALAGIAKPEAFFSMLRKQGLTLNSTEALPDHYGFDNYAVELDKGYNLICTEKDAVKLWAGPLRDRVLSVALALEPEPDFFAALDRLLERP